MLRAQVDRASRTVREARDATAEAAGVMKAIHRGTRPQAGKAGAVPPVPEEETMSMNDADLIVSLGHSTFFGRLQAPAHMGDHD